MRMRVEIEMSSADIADLGLGDREYFIDMYWFFALVLERVPETSLFRCSTLIAISENCLFNKVYKPVYHICVYGVYFET